jgi:2-polyprenyl-6-methoxyphenol hydroxylase-like FAD-dependent oxidoreductase
VRAAVVGAGIGGLASALALQRAGWDVLVLERAPSFVPVGSGLTIFPNGLRALEHLGLRDTVAAMRGSVRPGLRAGIRDPRGRWLATWSPDTVADAAVVERSRLHEVLLGALGATRVQTGREVVAAATGVVRLSGGDEVSGLDRVVAADGIHSRLRSARTDDPGIRYAGYQAWRAVTREPVATEAVGEVWGHARRFGVAPLGDGRVYWFATRTLPPDASSTDESSAVAELFGRWCDPVPRLLAATDAAAIQRLPIERLAAPVARPVDGRVVLVGDAAHAMTPDVGQGANQALEDAVSLAALLGATADVDAALARWSSLRVPRWVSVSRQARVAGRAGQLRGAPARVRDAVLRVVPSSLLDRGTAALHAWEPPEA